MGAPPQFGIEGGHPRAFVKFLGGRVTKVNLTAMPDEVSLIANNVHFFSDDNVTKRNGYTKVATPTAAKCLGLFDFQRTSDGAQFLISQFADGTLWASDVYGNNLVQLSNAESLTAKYRWVTSDFALYGSNGVKSIRIVDKAGVLKVYQWGMNAPLVAPSIAVGVGTLTLTYGRQYVYCPVSKITDAQGITRVSVGPPSPISAHTGPFASGVVTVGDIPVFADPQVTHIWIFATYDTPFNTTSVFNFDAEIVNGTTSFGDDTEDGDLDFSRVAPFLTNFPAPLFNKPVEYQSRIAALQIPLSPDFVQFSGASEIELGIEEECWPSINIFKIPGGKNLISGGEVFGQGTNSQLCFGTQDFWNSVTGADLTSFQLRTRMFTPGPIGLDATAVTNRHLLFIGKDKNLWAWDGTSDKATNFSEYLSKPLTGSSALSMQDMADSELANAKIVWFVQGQYSLIMVFCATINATAGTYDWVQIWDASHLEKWQPNLPTLSDGSSNFMAESDFFFGDVMSAVTVVEVANRQYVFMGDAATGKVYRWPDGFQDDGKPYTPVWGSAWTPGLVFIGPMFHPIPPPEVMKRFMFADLTSADRQDAATAFRLLGITLEGPDNTIAVTDCGLEPEKTARGLGPSGTRAVASLNKPGLSIGKWARYIVVFPNDNAAATLSRLALTARPVFGIRP